ncbi:hypothetical protein ONS96_010709 [Cadophora gregata f. sp. sojae]|nr:hypothetical protein ONS96_010709 [Cadophora gregata f. sp. sojae]
MSSSPQTSSPNANPTTPESLTPYPIPPNVLRAIQKVHSLGNKVIVMTCGITGTYFLQPSPPLSTTSPPIRPTFSSIPGSGKSTMAQNLQSQHNYSRLSIDSLIHAHHGVHGIDYNSSQLPSLQDEAETLLKSQLTTLLSQAEKDIVLDLSLYSKSDREYYREVVQREGARMYGVVLVVFRVGETLEEQEEVLWRRIERRGVEWVRARDEGRGMEGMLVERELLRRYLRGFEWPDGEGEIVVDVL